MDDKGRDQIGSVKPVGMPIFYRINQVIVKELALKTLVKLDPTAAENIGLFTTGLRLQTKEVAKKR